ncbi:MAG TPA: type II toxin-antitoxin system RelE/ParE family toxin [Roseiarcus sp.]|jgi:plasmid stabilization system protein ParE
MKVRYARRAQADLAKILNYLDGRRPRGALSVELAIKRTIDTIAQNPDLGNSIARSNVRSMPVARYPYLVFWTVEVGEIWVLHIRHGARSVWRG